MTFLFDNFVPRDSLALHEQESERASARGTFFSSLNSYCPIPYKYYTPLALRTYLPILQLPEKSSSQRHLRKSETIIVRSSSDLTRRCLLSLSLILLPFYDPRITSFFSFWDIYAVMAWNLLENTKKSKTPNERGRRSMYIFCPKLAPSFLLWASYS